MSETEKRYKEFRSGPVLEQIFNLFGVPIPKPSIDFPRVEIVWGDGEISVAAFSTYVAKKLIMKDRDDDQNTGNHVFKERYSVDPHEIIFTMQAGETVTATFQSFKRDVAISPPQPMMLSEKTARNHYKNLARIVMRTHCMIRPYIGPSVPHKKAAPTLKHYREESSTWESPTPPLVDLAGLVARFRDAPKP